MTHRSSASIASSQDRLLVMGELNFTTVVPLWKESIPLLLKCNQIHLDFSKVVSINSAGLALLLEWIKFAERTNKSIAFSHLPLQFKSIASVAGLNKLISIYSV